MTNRELIRGQFAALRSIFFWPLATFLILGFVPIVFWVATGDGSADFSQLLQALLSFSGGFATILWFTFFFIADIVAVTCFGMWLALSMKHPAWAAPMTILVVLVIPTPFCVLDIIADLIFIIWGITQLQQDFRWVFARQYPSRTRVSTVPLAPKPALAPPVIGQPS